jgi:hypothetical protein
MVTVVVNLRYEAYDVYIGRPSIFGNPFSVKKYGREECIERYREYFYGRLATFPEFKQEVLKLKGKRLGCFCKPEACHGDIIVKYLAGIIWND